MILTLKNIYPVSHLPIILNKKGERKMKLRNMLKENTGDEIDNASTKEDLHELLDLVEGSVHVDFKIRKNYNKYYLYGSNNGIEYEVSLAANKIVVYIKGLVGYTFDHYFKRIFTASQEGMIKFDQFIDQLNEYTENYKEAINFKENTLKKYDLEK